jgi:hypothetical protein
MAHFGTNTFKGVTFGIETTGNQGVPDFSDEHIYAKRDAPYATSNATTLQYGGKKSILAIDLVVIVHEDDWAAFRGAAGFTAGTLVWSSQLSRSNRTGVRLLGITNARQFPGDEFWRATAKFEG